MLCAELQLQKFWNIIKLFEGDVQKLRPLLIISYQTLVEIRDIIRNIISELQNTGKILKLNKLTFYNKAPIKRIQLFYLLIREKNTEETWATKVNTATKIIINTQKTSFNSK